MAEKVSLKLNNSKWKRFFSVPCALVDDYIRLADESALKLLLYLLCDESDEIDKAEVCRKLGIKEGSFDDAVIFWKEMGVMESEASAPVTASHNATVETKSPEVSPAIPSNVKVRLNYTPKTISDMIDTDESIRELFSEAEKTVGRLLKHAEQELLINLRDYYGFDTGSIILMLEYCHSCGKTSARAIESFATELSTNNITTFFEIDAEIKRRTEYSTFENEVKRALFLETKPTAKQSQFISSWQELGFSVEMIGEARERCVNQTNKLSFPYINKILQSWAEKRIFTLEALEADEAKRIKPAVSQSERKSGESSFDLSEFDSFTLSQSHSKK
ncbi:MAG: DnaD domain protein [Oscillospiraceae bacterium]|nr:DnaD domain protein [Oscillospiraceae bacterium]